MNNMSIMFRPPYEARSYLLLVTSGCSHNACRFCTMYKDVPFEEAPLDLVEKQLMYEAERRLHTKRVFLENGDPFTLSAGYLLKVSEMIHSYLPEVERITMYAQIRNIMTKTDEELKALAKAGIGELNIGLESGMDSVLRYLRKGYTAEEALKQMKRLTAAGISFSVNIIFGAAGAGNGIAHAKETAAVLNEAQPYLVFTNTIHSEKGCDLYADMQEGRFIEPTFGEYIAEEEQFLTDLEMKDAEYYGIHPANVLQLRGRLPGDKEALLRELRSQRDSADPELLKQRPRRLDSEGMIINWN